MSLQKFDKNKIIGFLLGCVLIVLVFVVYITHQATSPDNFPTENSFEILSGMTVQEITIQASDQGFVRSEFWLYAILTYFYDPTYIYAGTYIFTEPVSVFGFAYKLANQQIEHDVISITFPEGMRAKSMANIAEEILLDFSVEEYLLLTSNLEGYLFPETYFVPKTFTAKELIELQKKTYEQNISPLRPSIEKSPLTEYEVLILASIIEREANSEKSMRKVAGILLNRLAINMPLQADASIEYVIDTPLNELPAGKLAMKLRELDSPYNTYLNIGLPPTPIGNPGLMSIRAVLYPIVSEYLFYITAPDGVFHYAKTFAEHTRNVEKYLR